MWSTRALSSWGVPCRSQLVVIPLATSAVEVLDIPFGCTRIHAGLLPATRTNAAPESFRCNAAQAAISRAMMAESAELMRAELPCA